MTKAEELKLLERIEELLRTADPHGYIPMTFAGIVEVCRNNIVNDFGVTPVQDMETYKEALDIEVRKHDETKRMLAESQNALKEARRDMDGMRRQIDELTEERDAVAECLDGNNSIMEEMEAEILKLKADIVKFTVDRMTDEQMADLYDRVVKGA